MTISDLIIKYNDELQEDVKIDELNIKDKAMSIPAIKHKWVNRLIETKQNLNKLEKNRLQLIEGLSDKLIQQSNITLSKIAAKRTAESHESCQKFNQDIEDTQMLIEFLEKAEKVLNSMTYDVGNIIKIMQMEQM